MHITRTADDATGANAGERQCFAKNSRVSLSHRPGVAEFHRWAGHTS